MSAITSTRNVTLAWPYRGTEAGFTLADAETAFDSFVARCRAAGAPDDTRVAITGFGETPGLYAIWEEAEPSVRPGPVHVCGATGVTYAICPGECKTASDPGGSRTTVRSSNGDLGTVTTTTTDPSQAVTVDVSLDADRLYALVVRAGNRRDALNAGSL